MPLKGYKQTEEHKKLLSKNHSNFWLGHKHSEKSLEKMSLSHKLTIRNPHSKETKHKMSEAHKGEKSFWFGKNFSEEHRKKIGESNKAEKSFRWIPDRSKLKRYIGCEERRSPAYKFWRNEVYKRDNRICKINNSDCSGRLEVHHILGYTDHPELKYDINNGITLCHFHHPRKWEDEKRLSPYFQDLVSVSKD